MYAHIVAIYQHEQTVPVAIQEQDLMHEDCCHRNNFDLGQNHFSRNFKLKDVAKNLP